MLKDHLGSASEVTDSTGAIMGEDRFHPFGEARLSPSNMLTDKLFTGQREIADLRIYHYGARFYAPYINRFLSADTIVPDYANPQNLNRYANVLNNPVRYTDPTGHCVEADFGICMSVKQVTKREKLQKLKNKNKQDQDSAPTLSTVVPPGPCSGCSIVTTPLPPAYPNSKTYHLFESNVIYDLPIYDDSYFPKKVIGRQTMYYTRDDVHFSLRNFIVPSDTLTLTSTVQTAGDVLLWLGKKNLGELSKVIAPALCPECSTVLGIAAALDSADSAFTFDGHLETSIQYFPRQYPIFVTPFDSKKIR